MQVERAQSVPRRRLLVAVFALAALAGCASMPPGFAVPKAPSYAVDDPDAARTMRALAERSQSGEHMSGFRLLSVGVDGFLTRVQMADAARKTLDLQYFIFRNDDTGRIVADAVLRAADRGIRVRILIDDGDTVVGDERLHLLDAHPRIEVRVFNPFIYRGHDPLVRSIEFAFNKGRLDYRMHNKVFVSDNAAALVGGRNIGDEYFQVDPERQFADDDLFAVGPIVREVSARFDAYWNSKAAVPVAALRARPSADELEAYRNELAPLRSQPLPDGRDYSVRIASREPYTSMVDGRLPLIWAPATVVCDTPDKKEAEEESRGGALMARPVADATSAVRSELLLITPYLVPGDDGMQLLTDLRLRDVRVRLLTNSLETATVPAAHAGYMHYRRSLLEWGIDLFEVRARLGSTRGSGQSAALSQYGNYSLHGKMFVYDRRKVFVGSMNFDQRSMHLNTEIGLLVDSTAMAEQIVQRFEAMTAPENAYRLAIGSAPSARLSWTTAEDGIERRLDVEPARSAWQRVQVDALALLPIDKEL